MIRRWLPHLACLALSIFVCSPYLMGAVPPDGFTGVHLNVLGHVRDWLSGVGTLGVIRSIGAPQGLFTHVVGWSVLLVAVPLVPILGPVKALAVGQALHFAAGGSVMVAALRQMGLKEAAVWVGGLAWTAPPLFLSFLVNGQFENLVGFGLALAFWGLVRRGRWGWVAIGFAGLWTGFASPYHAVPLGLLVGCGFLMPLPAETSRLRGLAWSGGAIFIVVLGLLPAALYHRGMGPAGLMQMGPGPNREEVPLQVGALWDPWVYENSGRLVQGKLSQAAVQGVLQTTWGAVQGQGMRVQGESRERVHAVYVGAVLSALALVALVGLFVPERRGWVVAMWALAGVSVLFALGRGSFYVSGIKFYLPWTYTRSMGSLAFMGVTYRFVSGLIFAGSVLAALGAERLMFRALAPVVGLLLSVAVVVEGLSLGPRKVPLEHVRADVDAGYGAWSGEGAVLDLPPLPFRGDMPPEALPATMAAQQGHASTWTPSDGVSFPFREDPLVRAFAGGALSGEVACASLRGFQKAGVGYVALHLDLGNSAVPGVRAVLEGVLGPPQAVGLRVVGWRLEGSIKCSSF